MFREKTYSTYVHVFIFSGVKVAILLQLKKRETKIKIFQKDLTIEKT